MVTKWPLPFVLIFGCLTTTGACAHPVTFKGGTAVMSNYTKNRTDVEVNYSFEPNQAFGVTVSSILYNKERINFEIPHYNYLIKRWNLPDAQANLYLWGGVGASEYENDSSLAGLSATQLDYETRRIYTMVEADSLLNRDGDFTRAKTRIGIAPYIAPYTGFHTWLIAEGRFSHLPEQQGTFSVSPIVRFFYHNYLVEVGYEFGEGVMASTIFHF